MLPFHVWHDFVDVIDDMNRAGYELDASGSRRTSSSASRSTARSSYGAIEIELRQALEPWHVLGEEGAVGGTVRYVDSSVERLQVKVRGLTDGRYADRLQRLARAADADRPRRRVRRRRALSRLAARRRACIRRSPWTRR